MKKTILATMSGMLLGLILVVGVFAILHVESGVDDVFAQSLIETIGFAEDASDGADEADIVDDIEAVDELETMNDSETVGETVYGTELVYETETTDETEVEEDIVADIESEEDKADTTYFIRVNRSANCVTIYSKDENGEYTIPVKAMVCSVGLNDATPLGVGVISDKYEWRLLFGDVYGQYAVRFDGHIMFHSVPYTTTSKDALKDGEYNLLGQPASQGCIRLSVIDAKWIYDNCSAGTKVEVYDSADPGPLGKPEAIYIDPYNFFKGWDPTDPDPSNPWTIYGMI